jgi:guanosine-3',5'-bis(diphosphate) 3'-pyrophosphohydrolase
MNLEGKELIEKAREIAKAAHEGQTRKFGADKGKSYFDTHINRVADRALYRDSFIRATSFLHDTLEDTDVTVMDLRALRIPEEVIDAVVAMTKQDGETYYDFIRRVDRNDIARLVKRFDILDNSMNLTEGSLKDKYRFAYFSITKAHPEF